jgi:hypothetical protein
MDKTNLFDYCLTDIITKNKTIYFVGNLIGGNSLFNISINNDTNQIYKYSNEWLYLLNHYYPSCGIYDEFVNECNNTIESKNINYTFENENVIPFITSFSKGTIHGYSGLFFILTEYINNIHLYKDYKILVYIESQQGLLDIIHHFINKNIIDKEKIVYISSNVHYLFNSIYFIPNSWHTYSHNSDLKLELIDRFIINQDIIYEKERLCIIKSSISNNVTMDGIINIEVINNFCNKHNLHFIEPISINEIELINTIYSSRIFIASWGTAVFKNYVYLSDKCEKIIVLVIGENFINQYNNSVKNNDLLKKYKNAIFEYYITDENLNIDINI